MAATDIVSASPAGIGSAVQAATGSFVATGNNVSLVCGFNPRSVLVINETQGKTYRKLQGNSPNVTVLSTGAVDTTGLMLFPADAGLNEPGSTVLCAAAMFAAGDKVAWIVEG